MDVSNKFQEKMKGKNDCISTHNSICSLSIIYLKQWCKNAKLQGFNPLKKYNISYNITLCQ